MSLRGRRRGVHPLSFPRVSGDEPLTTELFDAWTNVFPA